MTDRPARIPLHVRVRRTEKNITFITQMMLFSIALSLTSLIVWTVQLWSMFNHKATL